MKETPESLPTESIAEDKKNYATEGAKENVISANNSNENLTTIADEKQSHFSQLAHFINQLYGKIPEPHFAYLITFKDKIETYSFSIANETQRKAMAHKAIELTNNGFGVWHSVNPVSIEPTVGKRGDEFAFLSNRHCRRH